MSTYASEVILVICVASDTAPALSPESTFFVEYCTGGPSSTTPVLLELCVSSSDTAPPPYYPACLAPLCLLSCVDPFDTAPPPQDLFAGLAGLLYTAPPPSTGDARSSLWRCLALLAYALGPPCIWAWSSVSMVSMETALRPCLLPVPAKSLASPRPHLDHGLPWSTLLWIGLIPDTYAPTIQTNSLLTTCAFKPMTKLVLLMSYMPVPATQLSFLLTGDCSSDSYLVNS
ncbi:uncharacterized protein UHOD_12317 [Ustilago sp. UG-2017b]|nr:uncharacterized protein UHOD_12317 [Ustilago sp. UG-2017b]